MQLCKDIGYKWNGELGCPGSQRSVWRKLDGVQEVTGCYLGPRVRSRHRWSFNVEAGSDRRRDARDACRPRPPKPAPVLQVMLSPAAPLMNNRAEEGCEGPWEKSPGDRGFPTRWKLCCGEHE